MALLPESVWTQVARAGRRTKIHLRDGLLGLLYPPRCLACDARAGAALCNACLLGLERARPETVRARIEALPEAAGVFDHVFACWRFDPDGALRALQHALKYQNRPRYGVAAGRWMGTALRDAFAPAALPDAVVPVPLHRTRELERGYNQSAQLARGLAATLGVPHRPAWLTRPRPTRSQTSLSRRTRWENVAGAFETERDLDGRTLLLVDDVLTTGATVTAAARVLRHAGAASVHLATLALAE